MLNYNFLLFRLSLIMTTTMILMHKSLVSRLVRDLL